jgi:integrase
LSIIRRFHAFVVGQFRTDQAEKVKQVHVIAYRNHLAEQGLKHKTISKKLASIKTLFNSAIEDGLLAPSEVQSVKITKAKTRGKQGSKARLPFELAELKIMFSPAIYLKEPGGAIEDSRAEYWAPLIALHTGMRVSEICQLRVSDIREHRARPYFSVIDNEDQELKTETSRRNVPVHEVLIRCGFMDFVETAREARSEWLWPELKPDKYGNRSSAFSKRWNRKLKTVISLRAGDHTKQFHSFRHLFKQIARQCLIGEEVHDALTGHAASKNSEGRKYGGLSYPQEPLFEAMRQFNIEGLDLSHLYENAQLVDATSQR